MDSSRRSGPTTRATVGPCLGGASQRHSSQFRAGRFAAQARIWDRPRIERAVDATGAEPDTPGMSVNPGDELQLADWRRQVSDLYAEVRRLAVGDIPAAVTVWREERERLYRDHPMSPVPADKRRDFSARHFDYDPTLRFEVVVSTSPAATPGAVTPIAPAGVTPLAPAPEVGALTAPGPPPASVTAQATPLAAPLSLPNSGADTLSFRRIGSVEIPFPVHGPRVLSLFWMEGYSGGLFLPFRDATSGSETYAAGRYLLDGAKSADLGGDPERGSLILDFNFAYQPSCAFDPRWACPLAPPENRLDLPIRAGERIA
jgi:uncharacterized protein (DUF1684 family)